MIDYVLVSKFVVTISICGHKNKATIIPRGYELYNT